MGVKRLIELSKANILVLFKSFFVELSVLYEILQRTYLSLLYSDIKIQAYKVKHSALVCRLV